MSLFEAITTKDVRTENGMVTHSTSSSAILDLFFKMGGSRSMSDIAISAMFSKAFHESDRLLATKAMFYNRDIRGGQGERRSFRIMFRYLCMNYPEVAIANLTNVVFYGRWDDILTAFNSPVEKYAMAYIIDSLKNKDGLCAKWMPRENKANGEIAIKIMKALNLSRREYRKMLTGNTEVVETAMCSNEWSRIDYNHVPSIAINKYRTSFYKHDESRFAGWIESLKNPQSGNAVHADAIFPHDIVSKYLGGGAYGTLSSVSKPDALLEAQWKALPDYVAKDKRLLTVVDVSGSMGQFGGLPIKVAVALGIYISERSTGVFKDGFITFSERPALQKLSGNLLDRVNQVTTSKWDMNTNLERVFDLILSKAVESGLPESEMPTDIVILSDMQFDICVNGLSAMGMVRTKYKVAGYTVPNVIFWNLRTGSGVPAKVNEAGVALVSGFSPSIMQSVVGGELSPMAMMLKVLNSERYSIVK